MRNNNMQTTTFWNFLKKHKIEIPIIQRDYAQGRIGKEKLREKFLKDIKNALDGKFSKDERYLKLDFVYGSIENNSLNPLDGQQRLTTLWLLHWYVAYKAGKLSEYKDVFKRFTYETRTSSREFCEKLSDFDLNQTFSTPEQSFIDSPKRQIVDLIQSQTWFFSKWKQDPTIQAMLTMLGGTTIRDNKSYEIFDGIEEVFVNGCDFKRYWEILMKDNCPIIFYYLDLEGLSLSDDLYIKMNARGKALTDFENFKADLVGFIKEKGWENYVDNPVKTVAHKLDTNWTDIFWKYKSEFKIDEIYFAFFNRFFLNYLITVKNKEADFLFTAEKLENEKSFKYIYRKPGDKTNINYSSFDIYNLEEEESIQTNFVVKISNTLDNFHSAFKNKGKEVINKLFLPSWDENSGFRFIPELKKSDDRYILPTLIQSHRVVFHAICCYFENGDYEEYNFKRWMRVVWNIVENANVETIPSMIGAMRLIDGLADYSQNIYEHLKDRDISKDFAKAQMEEEKEKAKQILNDPANPWESKIIEAEKTAFFKGAIRFLFRTEYNVYDWSKFDERFEKADEYFIADGVAGRYKKDAILLRTLISYFTKWGQFWEMVYDNNASSWRTILINEKWILPVGKLLDDDLLDLNIYLPPLMEKFDDNQKMTFKDLVYSDLLLKIENGCELRYLHYKHALYPKNTKSKKNIFVVADKRNKVLCRFEKENIIEIENWQRIEGIPFYRGWEINFKLKNNGKRFRWSRWNTLQELTESGEWEKVGNVTLDNLEEFAKTPLV